MRYLRSRGEPGQRGHVVTFLWRSPGWPGPPSPAVLLFVNQLAGERNLARSRMSRLGGADIWHLSCETGPARRISYAFIPYPDRAAALTRPTRSSCAG